MKAEDIKDVLDKYQVLESRVAKIIKDVFDDHFTCVNDIYLDDGDLQVYYGYTCRGCHDNDSCTFPVEWLEDGCDYKELARKAREEAEAKAEEEAKKQAEKDAAEQERKERAELARLKAKYPSA